MEKHKEPGLPQNGVRDRSNVCRSAVLQVLEVVAETDAPEASFEELLAEQPSEATQAERLAAAEAAAAAAEAAEAARVQLRAAREAVRQKP